jgi:hypothetical protein
MANRLIHRTLRAQGARTASADVSPDNDSTDNDFTDNDIILLCSLRSMTASFWRLVAPAALLLPLKASPHRAPHSLRVASNAQ